CKVVVDSDDHVIGYGCARLLSVVASPALCPIYADSDDAFVALFKALALCYEEEVKENNRIDIRSPSTKTPRIKQLLSDVAQITVKSQCTPQFTKYVPEHDIEKIYSITDMTFFI
uniref:YitH acetyltransferase (GNAT) domain-containing protein n=1 Tax=Parascaris univalens TaxID=6257 RepID=A0A915C0P1_PARUN